jgi:hypothetical protein
MLPNLRTYLEQCGTIVSLVPGPEESNWITVTYAAEWEAAMLLRRNGDVVGGKYLLGVKLAGPGSLAGCSLNTQTGQRNAAQSSQATEPASFASGVGTPMRMMSADVPSIFKPRTGTASGSGGMIDAADYDWDERPGRSTQAQNAQSGFLGRVGELVVSALNLLLLTTSLGDEFEGLYTLQYRSCNAFCAFHVIHRRSPIDCHTVVMLQRFAILSDQQTDVFRQCSHVV